MLDQFFSSIEHGWGLALILWFQSWRTPLIANLALFFRAIGSEVVIMSVILLIYWNYDKRLGRRLMPFLLLNSWVNAGLKAAFRRPRPFALSMAVHPIAPEISYGIPSGHAQNTTFIGGVVANQTRRWWILGVSVAYAILTTLSRLILGVHFPQDVLAGLILGLLMLVIYGAVEPRAGKWFSSLTLAQQIGALIAATLFMLAIYPGLVQVSSPAWLPQAILTSNLLLAPALAIGLFLGIGLGLILEARYLNFDSHGTSRQRIIRFLLGFIGIAILYYGLRWMHSAPLSLVFDLLRFALIGFWAAYGAPWLFMKFGLSSRRQQVALHAPS